MMGFLKILYERKSIWGIYRGKATWKGKKRKEEIEEEKSEGKKKFKKEKVWCPFCYRLKFWIFSKFFIEGFD